jgi:hypothetical protein
MRWAGHIEGKEAVRIVYKILVGKPKEKRQLGRPMRRWEDNIRIDLKRNRVGRCGLDAGAQDRDQWCDVVNMVMSLRVPKKAGNLLISSVTVSFSTRTLHRGDNWLHIR